MESRSRQAPLSRRYSGEAFFCSFECLLVVGETVCSAATSAAATSPQCAAPALIYVALALVNQLTPFAYPHYRQLRQALGRACQTAWQLESRPRHLQSSPRCARAGFSSASPWEWRQKSYLLRVTSSPSLRLRHHPRGIGPQPSASRTCHESLLVQCRRS